MRRDFGFYSAIGRRKEEACVTPGSHHLGTLAIGSPVSHQGWSSEREKADSLLLPDSRLVSPCSEVSLSHVK